MSAIEMQDHLKQLQAERALALIEGLENESRYVDLLDTAIAAAEAAYVGAAVTEIASLRAELSGPELG
jgi:hypothetical protein